MSLDFGRTLSRLRRDKGLSQEELAFRADLHRTYISQLERGLKSPSLDTIERIAKVFRLRAWELIRRAETKAP